MPDFPCIFKTTVNFPLSVWPPTSIQIISYLRPSSVENFGYHPGSLKSDMLVKRENVLEGCVAHNADSHHRAPRDAAVQPRVSGKVCPSVLTARGTESSNLLSSSGESVSPVPSMPTGAKTRLSPGV